jgi:hypothetical protein
MVQAASHLPHHLRNALGGPAHHLFDSPTPVAPSAPGCDYHSHPGDEPIAALFTPRQLLALGLFWGCVVHTPPGSSPCKPVALSRVVGER